MLIALLLVGAVPAPCAGCHDGAKAPSLAGILGKTAASRPGFAYSGPLDAAASYGLVWDRANLKRYLSDPQGMVPGSPHPALPLDDAAFEALVAALTD